MQSKVWSLSRPLGMHNDFVRFLCQGQNQSQGQCKNYEGHSKSPSDSSL